MSANSKKNQQTMTNRKKTRMQKPSLFSYFKKNWPKMAISTIVLAGLLSILFLWSNEYFKDKIYPGVRVLGINLTGKSQQEALSLIQDKITTIDAEGLKITYQGTIYQPTLSQLGYNLNAQNLSSRAYLAGRNDYPLFAFFKPKEIKVTPDLDEIKFKETINQKFVNLNIEPQSANFKIENNQVVLIEEKIGQEISWQDLKELISRNLNKNDYKNQNNEIKVVNKLPEIRDEDVLDLTSQIENKISKEITLKDEERGKTFKVTSDKIGSWLKISKTKSNATLEIDQEKIKNYLNDEIISKVNVKAKNKVIQGENGQTIDEGSDGRALDTNNTVAKLVSTIEQNKNSQIVLKINTVPPKEVTVWSGDAIAGGRYPGKYIEVVLGSQKLYCFEGENLINTFAVSTGKWSMPTPKGERAIYSKTERAWSEKYGLYMPWWNDIGGGYGIHELPEWPGGAKEGESHLGTPVSHGCIRLGVGAAQWLYDWAAIGTPVFIR